MSIVERPLSLEEITRRGSEIYEQQIYPRLLPMDHGKFVSIDVLSGEYELDEDDYQANLKLKTRLPNSQRFLARAGYRAAYNIRGVT
jgi:hypothetical protein